MSTSVLKEFLVSIGFDIDDNSYRRFKETMERTTEAFAALATQATAAALVVAKTVEDTADKLDKLYFASLRTGSAAPHLDSLSYAMTQVGINAQAAMGIVEHFASVLRTQPGTGGLLRMMGINPGDDPSKTLVQLLEKLQKVPYFMAAQYGRMFGIDESSLNLLLKQLPQLEKQISERDRTRKADGIDLVKAEADANRLETHRRELEARLRDVQTRSMERFLPLAERLMNFMDRIANDFFRLDAATAGWTTRIGELVAALGALKVATGFLRGILGLGAVEAGGALAVAGPVALGTGATYELWQHKDMAEAFGRQFLKNMPGWLGTGAPSLVGDKTFDTLEGALRHFEGVVSGAYTDIGGRLTSGVGTLCGPEKRPPPATLRYGRNSLVTWPPLWLSLSESLKRTLLPGQQNASRISYTTWATRLLRRVSRPWSTVVTGGRGR